MVTRSTLGVFGQRASSACSTRAVVDLPTATEPATPMMYGTLASSRAEEALLRPEQPLRGRDIDREQPRQRQIDLLDLLHVEPVMHRAQRATSSGVSVIGVSSRNAAHSARLKMR